MIVTYPKNFEMDLFVSDLIKDLVHACTHYTCTHTYMQRSQMGH